MPTERATIVKQDFIRWLPAIARTSHRRTALSVAGLVAIGGLAVAPTAYAAPFTNEPHPDAVSAIDLATGKGDSATVELDKAAEPDKLDVGKPGMDKLVPYGVQGVQSRIPLDDAQLTNAKAITETAKKTGVGERGAVIGVATSLQESKLYNLGHLGAINDHDSQGLFQQRPSSGWGSPDQITDPEYASTAFFNGLKNVGGWQELPLTAAAQTVQVSAYPFAYAQWEQQAADIVQQVW